MKKNSHFSEINGNFGFGCMRLPMLPDNTVDNEQAKAMTDAFLEAGFNYFDTAHGYLDKKSEPALRDCLTSRYPRDRYLLADKMSSTFFNSEEDVRPQFMKQLEICGVEYFDFFLMHALGSRNYEKYKRCNGYSVLRQLRDESYIRHLGFSFHDSPELLDKVLSEHPEMEFVQIQLNYFDYENPGVRSRECYEVCLKYNKPIIVMEPVKGGTLVNMGSEIEDMYKKYNPSASVASWAIRFAASHKNVAMVLSGMSNMEQLEDNTSYMKDFVALNDEENALIKKAVEILNKSKAVPCTGCSYCTEGCPIHIAIPKYFALLKFQYH